VKKEILVENLLIQIELFFELYLLFNLTDNVLRQPCGEHSFSDGKPFVNLDILNRFESK
jgi:hypothetical protein